MPKGSSGNTGTEMNKKKKLLVLKFEIITCVSLNLLVSTMGTITSTSQGCEEH